MKVIAFNIDPELVEKGVQVGGQFVRVQNACLCGCAPYPFVSLSDGHVGLTLRFENEAEIDEFKHQVQVLAMTYSGNCRCCEYLVDKRPPRTMHYIWRCKFDLLPESCGKFQLASIWDGHDPRVYH